MGCAVVFIGDGVPSSVPSRILVSRGQTLFFAQGRYRFQYKRPARGAYTESDNAPARKIGSGHARLAEYHGGGGSTEYHDGGGSTEYHGGGGSTEYHGSGELSQNPLSILMNSQKEMLEMFNKLSNRISNIEKTIMSSSSCSSGSEEKCRIPPQLSVSIYKISYQNACVKQNFCNTAL